MNREAHESPDEAYDGGGLKNWESNPTNTHKMTRSDTRFMVFWGLGKRPSELRCCFPMLAEAIEQGEKNPSYNPNCVLDRLHNNEVVHSFG